jgi:hypothetical protein
MSHMPFCTVESNVVETRVVPIFAESSVSGIARDAVMETTHNTKRLKGINIVKNLILK